MRSDLIDITVQKIAETSLAVLVTDSVPDNAVWLPKSQIEIEKSSTGGLYTVTMPERLAIEKGLV